MPRYYSYYVMFADELLNHSPALGLTSHDIINISISFEQNDNNIRSYDEH
jgi:hypothetical protein